MFWLDYQRDMLTAKQSESHYGRLGCQVRRIRTCSAMPPVTSCERWPGHPRAPYAPDPVCRVGRDPPSVAGKSALITRLAYRHVRVASVIGYESRPTCSI